MNKETTMTTATKQAGKKPPSFSLSLSLSPSLSAFLLVLLFSVTLSHTQLTVYSPEQRRNSDSMKKDSSHSQPRTIAQVLILYCFER